ncbi:proteoglycan 4-like, partial [Odontomachus brunneus]|uniref:proteoglycan 4-like n=1 Tax=Odontomachus brunneus TaxID=486640 RepID=UPI0013F219C6
RTETPEEQTPLSTSIEVRSKRSPEQKRQTRANSPLRRKLASHTSPRGSILKPTKRQPQGEAGNSARLQLRKQYYELFGSDSEDEDDREPVGLQLGSPVSSWSSLPTTPSPTRIPSTPSPRKRPRTRVSPRRLAPIRNEGPGGALAETIRPWRLLPVCLPPVRCTRPPLEKLTTWDVRARRPLSPRYASPPKKVSSTAQVHRATQTSPRKPNLAPGVIRIPTAPKNPDPRVSGVRQPASPRKHARPGNFRAHAGSPKKPALRGTF